jgi:probable phosphoglycerate mutase
MKGPVFGDWTFLSPNPKSQTTKTKAKITMPSLYLVRHASPDWNRKDIPYHLPPGPPLTEQGHAEARALGQFLRLAEVQQLWASPLERCLHTAEIVAGITGAVVTVNQELREWQPKESQDALRARMLPVVDQAWQWMVGQNGAGGAVALVTHGGPIMALLSALGIDDRTMETLRIYDHRNPVPPAGVWEIGRPTAVHPWDMHLVFTPEAVTA